MNILIYDSGIGGKSVSKLLEEYVTKNDLHEKIHLSYFADTANYPYGTKSEEELKNIVFSNLEKFKDESVDIVAVACNTASAVLEGKYIVLPQGDFECVPKEMKVFTIIEPTVRLVEHFQPKSIFVIASNFTANNHIYQKAIHQINQDINVREQAEQDLINHIEMEFENKSRAEIEKIVRQIQSGESLLWGCTHFSLVKHLFLEEITKQDKEIQIIDPAEELAKKVIVEIEKLVT